MLVSGLRAALAGFIVSFVGSAVAQETAVPKTPPPESGPAPAATSQPSGPAPRMEFTPKEINFGTVWQGMPAEGEVTIKNVGEAPLTITAHPQCGCTTITKPKSPLAPGESTSFKAAYDAKRPAENVQKGITLTSNDPAQPSTVVKIAGTVKPLFLATPRDQIMFNDLEVNSKDSQSLKLVNHYDQPLKLKLKEGQDFGTFEIELKEVTEGKEYELVASTKPPMRLGFNRAEVVVETGFDKVPTITYMVTGNAQPRVLLTTPQLLLPSTASQPTEQYVRLQYRVETPVKITEVKSTLPAIQTEIMPPGTPTTGQKVTFQMVKVKLPKYEDVPDEGAKLEVYTDDQDPAYHKFDVPIVKRQFPATQPVVRPQPVRPQDGKPSPQ